MATAFRLLARAVGSIACLWLLGVSQVQAAPPPAIEMTSLLEAFQLHHKSGRLDLNSRTGANAVFMPEQGRLAVALFRKGQPRPIAAHACSVRKLGGIWSSVRVAGASHHEFKEAGEYSLAFYLDGKAITSFDFTITIEKSGDAFQPASTYYVDGPWNELGFLQVVNGDPDTPLTFKFWTRQQTSTPDNNMKASVQLFRGEELVADAGAGAVAWTEWSLKEFSFRYPDAQGGQKFSTADLLKNDGSYVIRVKFDDQLHGYYAVEVRGGEVVPHDRQAMGYEPATAWLVPRRNQALDAAEPIYWLPRSQEQPAAADRAAADSSANSNRQPGRHGSWEVVPDADPGREFTLVHTKVLVRRDMPIAAGDGIVAFATGSSQGVGYFRVGDDRPLSIPNGQSFRSDLFRVCGKRIVLTTRHELSVFDSVSGNVTPVPADDIHMRYQGGALYGPQLLHSDGYLVATVNEPSRVRDRAVIKVLDLSSAEPKVISLSNIDFSASDVSSVAVSARHGYVAVGSQRKQAIFVAPIATRAKFKKFDLSGFDSFGDMQMALLDRYVLYQDRAGFSSVRVLDLESGQVMTPELGTHGGSWGTSVAAGKGLATWPGREPHATFVVWDPNGGTRLLESSGQDVPAGFRAGTFGRGNSAVVAHDGTIFLAGSQSISEQKCLQVSDGKRWLAVRGANGEPIPAIDVVLGDAMIAFKTGTRSTSAPVSVSYATYGEVVGYRSPSSEAAAAAGPVASSANSDDSQQTSPEKEFVDVDQALLKVTLEAEQEIFKALESVFGRDVASQRAVDTAIQSLRANGKAHLIDEYKRRSPLVKAGHSP